jgi:hypothetical protein
MPARTLAGPVPISQSPSRLAFRAAAATHGSREVPEEVAADLTYGGSTHAVMTATRADLGDSES